MDPSPTQVPSKANLTMKNTLHSASRSATIQISPSQSKPSLAQLQLKSMGWVCTKRNKSSLTTILLSRTSFAQTWVHSPCSRITGFPLLLVSSVLLKSKSSTIHCIRQRRRKHQCLWLGTTRTMTPKRTKRTEVTWVGRQAKTSTSTLTSLAQIPSKSLSPFTWLWPPSSTQFG